MLQKGIEAHQLVTHIDRQQFQISIAKETAGNKT
jgi:hypothetical protein